MNTTLCTARGKELQPCGYFSAGDVGIREYSVQQAVIKTVLYCTQNRR
jgi:hypothetical protein